MLTKLEYLPEIFDDFDNGDPDEVGRGEDYRSEMGEDKQQSQQSKRERRPSHKSAGKKMRFFRVQTRRS